jgi:DNA-binding MarR family transcriptional regulator
MKRFSGDYMDFKVDNCIFFQLAKASQAGAKFWTSCVSKYHLTAVQGMVMNFLGQEDEITSSELGKRAGLDSATLTGILDRLATARLIERRRHPDDRRAIQICLTGKGCETAKEIYDMSLAANKTFLSSLSPDEVSTLQGLLERVRGSGVSV